MKIAQIAPLYESVPPVLYGGTERVVSWLTEELVSMGHEVTLFASGDSVTTADLQPMCPRALRLDARCIDATAQHVNMVEQVYQQASAFDLIHSHVDYLHFSLSRRSVVPSVTTLHGRLDIPDLVPIFQTFREMPVVSISNSQRKPLPWANWQGTVYHGMPKQSLKFESGGGGYLAFLGRISPEKGVDEAIAIARQSGMPLKIAAKVDPGDRLYFESHIKPLLDGGLVEYIGEIGHDRKNEFLGNASALLFPICWPEPFGIVMIEAMACGTPVIAYKNGSVPEVMKEGVTGFVVSNVAEAVKAVERLGKVDRRRCREYFELHFSAHRMAKDYTAIYEKLVRGETSTLTMEDGAFSWTDLLPNTTT